MLWWLLALPALWLFILLLFAGPARAAWHEPVLRHPVLIIESDDWGPGPATHAASLRRLATCLNQYRDAFGRAPVMTLGLTLSLPDSDAIRAAFPILLTPSLPLNGKGWGEERCVHPLEYHAFLLSAPAYVDILAAIREGIQACVFAPQLHGMAHYWPDTLMRAACRDPSILAWVLSGPGQETEALPSPLQSRWCDTSVLPSRPLPAADIAAAVAEEVNIYRSVFGHTPAVAVPPTFVWTEAVEASWAAQGVVAIVTPGQRCCGRDAEGRPACTPAPIHNGQRGVGGITYLVRDRYFEPARGHCADQGLAALAEKTGQGRPCLLETHRFNFTGEGLENALGQLDKLLRSALAKHPDVRFLSTAELAEHYSGNSDWLTVDPRQRFAAWVARMKAVPRFAKLARLTGLALTFAVFTPSEKREAT